MARPIFRNGELAGAFVVRDAQWREKIYFGGLLLLLVHPFAWPVLLGYRKELIARLFSGENPLLPEWEGRIPYYFFEGLKAMGVIFGYLSPLYAALITLLLTNGITPDVYWFYSILFFSVFMIFSTLSFPAAVIYWTFFSETYQMPIPIAAVFLFLFSATVFFIPAAFLQVSKRGSYLSAFDVRSAVGTLRTHFRAYLFAWYYSTLMSLAGHLVLPFAPWGVVWCYLGIIFAFNSILDEDDEIPSNQSWFERFRGTDELFVEPTDRSRIWKSSNAVGATGEACFFFQLGPIQIPLPMSIVRFLRLEI